eukprot:jgi/Psemu1/8486/gm1.8486_g
MPSSAAAATLHRALRSLHSTVDRTRIRPAAGHRSLVVSPTSNSSSSSNNSNNIRKFISSSSSSSSSSSNQIRNHNNNIIINNNNVGRRLAGTSSRHNNRRNCNIPRDSARRSKPGNPRNQIQRRTTKQKQKPPPSLPPSQRSRPGTATTASVDGNHDGRTPLLSSSSSSSSSSSVASSIVDQWEDDPHRHPHRRTRSNSRSAALYAMEAEDVSRSNSHSNACADATAAAAAAASRSTSVVFDRFRDRQNEYCRALDDYRSFWYPHDSSSSSSSSSSTITTDGKQMPVSNSPPPPAFGIPIPTTTSPFRTVCAAHHHLFMACASCLTEHTETQKQQQQQQQYQQQYQYQQQRIDASSNNDDDDNDDDWTEEDRFRAECETLLTSLLPRWETLRRERAALVHRYCPRQRQCQCQRQREEESPEEDRDREEQEESVYRYQQQQISPWATTPDHSGSVQRWGEVPSSPDPTRAGAASASASASTTTTATDQKWVGWLKKIIKGDEHEHEHEHIAGEDYNNNNSTEPRSLSARAHLDPECAPNHYHYTKLIGQLYFHYLPHERHIRKNPFHSYTKTERDRDLAAARSSWGSSYNADSDNDDNENENANGNGNDHPTRAPEATGGNSISNAERRLSYPEALTAYEQRRQEILRERAATMQSVIDHALVPLVASPISSSPSPSSSYSGTTTAMTTTTMTTTTTTTQLQEDDSNRVLTDKIVRLLIRSYLDQETLAAAQQAERIYHRHPNHRKHLLWYVAMSYLRVVKAELKQQQQRQRSAPGNNSNSNINSNNNNSKDAASSRTAQPVDDAVFASKRICELVSSKYAKETREFQHLSVIAFEALAVLPESSRRKWKGYYDRVHSLGILKFGPKVWEALIHGSGSTTVRDGGSEPRSPSPNATNTNPPLQVVDLCQSLNSNDHKTLHHLIQIYSNDEQYFARALRLLDVSLDLYPAYDLQDSLKRSTFHKLLRRLLAQREKSWDATTGYHKSASSVSVSVSPLSSSSSSGNESNNGSDNNNNSSNSSSSSSSSSNNDQSRELETAFRILDKMITHEWWFPNEDTFRILFPLASYSPNPAPGTERLMAKLEACRFLSAAATTTTATATDAFSHRQQLPLPPHPFCPLEASAHALTAWMATASYHQYAVPPGHPHPAERAWAILRGLRVGSAPPLLLVSNEDRDRDRSEQGVLASASAPPPAGTGGGPTEELYTLALRVCSRVLSSSRSLEVALDIFEAVQEDQLLLEGEVCRVLLGVVMNFTTSDADNRKRLEATKRVYSALMALDPDFGTSKPTVLGFLRKQASYIRIRHPELYESHLAELGLLEEQPVE